MSTVAVHPPSHSSPLRPREDPALRTPRTATALRNTSSGEMRRSMSSDASARAAGNNASRSPSADRGIRGQQHVSNSRRDSNSPQSTYPPKPTAPSSNPNSSPNVPLIKKELPSSPESAFHPANNQASLPPSRHRPRKLDLSRNSNKSVPPGASTVGARPSTKDSAGLNVLHDMGIACLSPGFQSQDPSIQAQLQKSMDIREHQRRLIESQMHGKSVGPGGEKSAVDGGAPPSSAFGKPPGSSRRKGPPPGLAIHAPNAQQFAHEPRVIQSAPLNQTFSGLPPKHPSSLSRQVLDRAPPPAPGGPQYAGPGTPSQPSNRLPPISDVLDSARGPPSGFHAPHSTYSPAHPSAAMASPGYLPPASAGLQPPRSHPASQPQQPSPREGYPVPPRQRDFKSAEEAVQGLSGGREDLQPRLVHYGGHQPPTPPSPRHQGDQKPPPTSQPQYGPRSGSGRRRTREEYERDLAEADRTDFDHRERDRDWERRRAAAMNDERRYAAWEEEQQRGRRAAPDTGPFGHHIHSPETNRRKKDEFMALCARAWDLLHS